MRLAIITDNEWTGKYPKLEEMLAKEGIDTVVSLGDNLPTGPREKAGSQTYFKNRLEELAAIDPSLKQRSIAEQMEYVCNQNPEAFLAYYQDCFGHIKGGADFLSQSSLPQIVAITGNREFDYQDLLDLLARRGLEHLDYMEEHKRAGKFDLYDRAKAMTLEELFRAGKSKPFDIPEELRQDKTGVLLLPYNPNPEAIREGLIREMYEKLERTKLGNGEVIVMTHENPNPLGVGATRKAKNQSVIDDALAVATLFGPVLCFCGHLDKSAKEHQYFAHDAALVDLQPISGSEVVFFDTANGEYDIRGIE